MKAKKLLRKRKKITKKLAKFSKKIKKLQAKKVKFETKLKKLSHTKAIVKKHVTSGEGKVNNNLTPVTVETTQAH
jgi:septal ring factor EnvC (AmiA/AmiB activator)